MSNLSPDPAPGASTTTAAPRSAESAARPHVAAPTVVVGPVVVRTTPASAPRDDALASKPKPRRPAQHPRARHVAVVDVPPLHVDVPIGLGAVAAEVRDDSTAVLAAIALLATACAAASGAALILVAGREGAAA